MLCTNYTRRLLSSRRCFEPGPILIFAKVKMGPGLEAYRGDIHFCWVSPFTFGSGYAGLGNCVNRELGNSRVPEYALPGGIGLQRGALLSIEYRE